MSIEAINATPLSNNVPVSAANSINPTNPIAAINPSDVAAFQSLLSDGAVTPAETPEATDVATLADFYKQVQYDVVNMCIQYIPTFRD
jgi:hypothetical protein